MCPGPFDRGFFDCLIQTLVELKPHRQQRHQPGAHQRRENLHGKRIVGQGIDHVRQGRQQHAQAENLQRETAHAAALLRQPVLRPSAVGNQFRRDVGQCEEVQQAHGGQVGLADGVEEVLQARRHHGIVQVRPTPQDGQHTRDHDIQRRTHKQGLAYQWAGFGQARALAVDRSGAAEHEQQLPGDRVEIPHAVLDGRQVPARQWHHQVQRH